jgi:DNA-binding transcriptional regulator YiaG
MDPRTIGEHLKKRRMDLDLPQRDAAGELGTNQKTYENWEQRENEPATRIPTAWRETR